MWTTLWTQRVLTTAFCIFSLRCSCGHGGFRPQCQKEIGKNVIQFKNFTALLKTCIIEQTGIGTGKKRAEWLKELLDFRAFRDFLPSWTQWLYLLIFFKLGSSCSLFYKITVLKIIGSLSLGLSANKVVDERSHDKYQIMVQFKAEFDAKLITQLI